MPHKSAFAFGVACVLMLVGGAVGETVRRVPEEDVWGLADRLFMTWQTHAMDVFVRDETVVRLGGARAPVPTVLLDGTRSHITAFARPRVEDLPRRAEDPRGIWLRPAEGGDPRWVPYGETGRIISSVNREILSRALQAAERWTKSGDVFDRDLAYNTLDTYLAGILHRNVPTDLDGSPRQNLFGLQTHETIQDKELHTACALYALLKPFAQTAHPDALQTWQLALKKWAEVQIANGVPNNNWDMMQLNFILDVALVLEPDAAYPDRKGREHYLDVVLHQSSVRNLSVKDLAAYGFDPNTGIWFECPGYSLITLGDFGRFAERLRKEVGRDLLEDVPVLKKAFPAAGEYLFPDGSPIGYGDTHPTPLGREILQYGKPQSSPFFYTPNASWLICRSGMKEQEDVAFALNASLGNHQHANGISMELYARGYRFAPDGGIGWDLYKGKGYREYYSKFPAHNTVMVDSRSDYPAMLSHHGFTLVTNTLTSATVSFREPSTGAEQRRTLRYVKDAVGAYFIDVFRSRVGNGKPHHHDYLYHNLGDALELNGPLSPSTVLAPTESGNPALAHLTDREARAGTNDLRAVFRWQRPEGARDVTVFMNGAPGRTFVRALSPATEGLSRIPKYGITKASHTPLLIARQEGPAWEVPFIAVIDPYGTVAEVTYASDHILVRRQSGTCDRVNLED